MKNFTWNTIDIDKIECALKTSGGKITFGIDGYVDEVWEVVESRTNNEQFKKYNQMKAFGSLIVDCGTGGLSTEIVRKRRTFGGFTANTGKAASSLGVDTTMIGLYGKVAVDAVFKEFEQECHVFSLGDPAVSHIMEFEDGKLMLVYIKEIMEIGWKDLTSALSPETLKTIFIPADIIAFGYWSNMPAFDEFIEGISANYLSTDHSQRLFLDLADIRKREEASLHQSMDELIKLNKKLPITLSLNEHEAELLFACYGISYSEDPLLASEQIESLRKRLQLDEIIVHTPQHAAGASAQGEAVTVLQRYCEKPVRTTAAGDHFNGGYLAARLTSLDLGERLAVANASARVFLQTGHSSSNLELIDELRDLKNRL